MQESHKNSRLVGIDLARVCAITFMVQGHAIDVLLAPQFRSGAVYDAWLFLRGLTAPMFLVLAGVSFTVATTRKWELHSSLSPVVLRRVRRFLFFIAFGYLMHMPVRFPWGLRTVDAVGWQSWLQVDVLQCVGVTLLVLQLLVFVCRTPIRMAIVTLAIAMCIVLATPISWVTDWNTIFSPGIAAYMNGNSGSLFPLFPWAAFILAGPSLALLYTRNVPHFAARRALASGAVLVILGCLLELVPWTVYRGIDFWRASPNLFLMKLGSVCILLSGIAAVAKWWVSIPANLLRTIAQKSLLIYIAHLAVLYGSAWNPGLRQYFGPTLGVGATMIAIVTLLTMIVLSGIVWNWHARETPNRISLVRGQRLSTPIATRFEPSRKAAAGD